VASYEILIKPSAARELEGIDKRRDRQRLVERIDDGRRTVTIFRIGHRRDVYG
jgi:mRNA-degrading endonuclease RelE of RelBE toxin-antitoxin system